MKVISLTILLYLAISNAYSQHNYNNFSPNTIDENELLLIQEDLIDSLKNQLSQYGITDANSKISASANYIYVDKGRINSIKRDLDKNMPYELFMRKHPQVKTCENLVVVKSSFTNYKNEINYNYSSIPTKDSHVRTITTSEEINTISVKGKWVYNYIPGSAFSEKAVLGFYFTSDFGINLPQNQVFESDNYVNTFTDKSELFLQQLQKRTAFDKILSFMERLIDVCAALIINYNNPNLIHFGVANMILPKMTKPIEPSP